MKTEFTYTDGVPVLSLPSANVQLRTVRKPIKGLRKLKGVKSKTPLLLPCTRPELCKVCAGRIKGQRKPTKVE